jgi:uncharacterized protein (DUF1778 family)
MKTMPRAEDRPATLTLPILPRDRELLAAAAKASGETLAAFVRRVALRAATEALCDQCLVESSPEAYRLFLARLDRPAQPNDRLRATMQTTPPWET